MHAKINKVESQVDTHDYFGSFDEEAHVEGGQIDYVQGNIVREVQIKFHAFYLNPKAQSDTLFISKNVCIRQSCWNAGDIVIIGC